MGQDLIQRREQAIARADKALDAVWPHRLGHDYVNEMQWTIHELEIIANEMEAKGFDLVEQSRTYRLLASLYADLEPSIGKEMLIKAKKFYKIAETLLIDQSDDLERAKLNFNFGNTLRLIDPNDIEQLQEANKYLLAARVFFVVHAPQYLTQTDEALKSIENLLKIAPLANTVKKNTDDMTALQKKLDAGDNINDIHEKAKEVMKRGGGAAGMVGQLQAIIDALPAGLRRSGKFTDIQNQMQELTKQVIGNDKMSPEVKQIWLLLNHRLKKDLSDNSVSRERAESLSGMLEEFGRILSGDEKDINAMLEKAQRLREFIDGKFEMNHYLSHELERPPVNSRAAILVELNWQLRRYLLEEMNRPEKGEEESKEALDLNLRASRVDKRIHEAGADNTQAMILEKEELRPLSLAIRNFSARMNTMIAKPVWLIANVPLDTNAVFYSGSMKGQPFIAGVCRRSGLEIIAEPRGESYASARWEQLQKAIIAVFDLRVNDGLDMAAVNYELGIALTLGKPIVLLIAEGQTLPFDVEIEPIVFTGETKDDFAISAAIDKSVVWTYPRPHADASVKTLEYILSLYKRPQQNIYVDQTLRILSVFQKSPDPLSITRTLLKFFDYLKDGETMLIHPLWSQVYPEDKKLRLFHVMPYSPTWADNVAQTVREVCEVNDVKYVRGDEVDDANVIRSIWHEIAQATHVLVDLTGFNPNVALELGIAHTLGKKILIAGQGDAKSFVFKSISKFRVHSYEFTRIKETLGKELNKFLLSAH